MSNRDLVIATINLFEVDIGELEGVGETVLTAQSLIDDLIRTGWNFRHNDRIVALTVEALEVINSSRKGYDGQKVAQILQRIVDRLRLELTELTEQAVQ